MATQERSKESLYYFTSRRRHTRYWRDWSSDECSSDLAGGGEGSGVADGLGRRARRRRHVLAAQVAPRHAQVVQRRRDLLGTRRRLGRLHLPRADLLRPDRKSVVQGKGGDPGGRRIIKT